MQGRGRQLLAWAGELDAGPQVKFAARPQPKPPLADRPGHFSVTEIETLRRDPYAIYARRILRLKALDPLLRDPGAAERGTLFHAILHRFSASGVDPRDPAALACCWRRARSVSPRRRCRRRRGGLVAAFPAAGGRDRRLGARPRRECDAAGAGGARVKNARRRFGGHAVGLCRSRRHPRGKAWPTFSTTRPARRPPRARRTRCLRRSSRWRARCSGAAPSRMSGRSSRPTSPSSG